MRVQGYIEIDNVEMTEEEQEQFSALMNQYMLHYYQIDSGVREYYFCILIDVASLDILTEALSDRHPVINGLWTQEGMPYGVTKTTNMETGQISESCEPEYGFDLDLHIAHIPSEITIDKDGNMTETIVTEFKPLHGFAGWAVCQAY